MNKGIKMDYRTCSECGKKINGRGKGSHKCVVCQRKSLRKRGREELKNE